MKESLKRQAVVMRLKGMSYSEILKEISVSKSTLSLWLRTVGLTKRQTQDLTEKKLAGMKRGSEKRRLQRISKETNIIRSSEVEFNFLQEEESLLKIIGAVLYWAEGAKQKNHNVSQGVVFANSDILMIKIFLRWLGKICHVQIQDIGYELYIHESADIEKAMQYWKEGLGVDTLKIRYKKHIPTHRRNIGFAYNGMMRVRVKKSTDLNRRITGWINGICNLCGVV